ncbi:MAG: hypothetical protein JSV99_03735 [Planctomycetota bacterium]|nr:MAG: hypothetical protein JSV99_03735 [Planctomycetota bacterium]
MKTTANIMTVLWLLALCGIVWADGSTNESPTLLCAVGWFGEFAHIDPTVGVVSPTRYDLPSELQALAWSPDATLYAGRKDDLYTLDPMTGDVNHFLSSPGDIRAMAFSPSGVLYVAQETGGGHLRTIDLVTGQRTEIGRLLGAGESTQGLAFSPDGVLYGISPKVWPGTYRLFTIDVNTAAVHLIASYSSTASVNQSIAFTPDGRLFAIGEEVFAQLDPTDGSVIGDPINLSGCGECEFRGLAVVHFNPPVLTRLEIVGPAQVRENCQAQYSAIAHYDNNSIEDVTELAQWFIEPNTVATIDSNGLITTGDVNGAEEIVIYAEYTENDTTTSAEIAVTVTLPQTLHVPSEYQTIQAAIHAAGCRDTIVVAPGLYEETVYFLGKNITLTSIDPTDPNVVNDTIIDDIVVFRGTEDPNCTLTGFNIDGGIRGFYWPPPGSGTDHTRATISHCLLDDVMTGCDATIMGCDGTISNCLITPAAHMCDAMIPAAIVGCHGLIKNCTIVCTYEDIAIGPNGTCTIENSIIYQYDVRCAVRVPDGSTVNISYTDVLGGLEALCGDGTVNWGPGNIDADPCFADPDYGDYRLLEISPCIDAGDPNYVPEPNETDLDGNPRVTGYAVDMGAYEYPLPLVAEIHIRPRTLNLRSKGKWIACRISLPEGYSAADIDPNSILLEGQIEPASFRIHRRALGAVAFFSRRDLRDILDPGPVELTITGQLTDGTKFMGSDTIKVIDNRGRRRARSRKPKINLRQLRKTKITID